MTIPQGSPPPRDGTRALTLLQQLANVPVQARAARGASLWNRRLGVPLLASNKATSKTRYCEYDIRKQTAFNLSRRKEEGDREQHEREE